MAGAVRATMASISAEPESDEVRLLLAGADLLVDMRVRSCARLGCEIGSQRYEAGVSSTRRISTPGGETRISLKACIRPPMSSPEPSP